MVSFYGVFDNFSNNGESRGGRRVASVYPRTLFKRKISPTLNLLIRLKFRAFVHFGSQIKAKECLSW